MNRLNTIAIACFACAALALASCSGGGEKSYPGELDENLSGRSPVSAGQVSGGRQGLAMKQGSIAETAIYGGSTPVDFHTLRPSLEEAQPSLTALPQLPMDDLPLKLPSEAVVYAGDGSDSFMASANSSDAGKTKILTAGQNEISWAIYQVPDLNAQTSLVKIVVETAEGVFSGDRPGYWFGMANYSTGKWQMLTNSQIATYQRTFSATEQYRSPGGNAYFVVLIADGQSVNVDEFIVDLEVETVGWQEVVLSTGPNDGYTASLGVNLVGDPMIVFADYHRQNAYITSGNSNLDLLSGTSWTPPQALDPFPPFVAGPDNRIHWTDMHFDSQFLTPVVSMVYEGNFIPELGAQDTSMLCFAPYVESEGMFRLYYGLWVDGAMQTSIARDTTQRAYGIALCADNTNWEPLRPRFDMEVRYIEFDYSQVPNAGENLPIQLTRGFGLEFDLDYFNPHLRFDPLTGSELVAANGAHLLSHDIANSQWLYLPPDGSFLNHGAIAFSPTGGNDPAHIFTEVSGANQSLLYFPNVFSPTPTSQTVDTASGAGNSVGASQELAFDSTGRPHIAYTERIGSEIFIRYAFNDGLQWVLEDVSPEASSVPTEAAGLRVDLVLNASDEPMICYNKVGGGTSLLRFAMRVGN